MFFYLFVSLVDVFAYMTVCVCVELYVLLQWRNYNFGPPSKHLLWALVHL